MSYSGVLGAGEVDADVVVLVVIFGVVDIEVDGGVGPGTIDTCAIAGANMIVSGTAVVKSEDPRAVMDNLRQCVQKYL